MNNNLDKRVKTLWYNLFYGTTNTKSKKYSARSLCKRWQDFNNFKEDIKKIQGSELFLDNTKCKLQLIEGSEYNINTCKFVKINSFKREKPYEPTPYEMNYLKKCINTEIKKYSNLYYMADELYSLGNYAIAKACCTFKDSYNEFKFYALQCIQNEYKVFFRDSVPKINKQISYDVDYTDDKDNNNTFLDVLTSEDDFKDLEDIWLIKDLLNTLTEKEKEVILLYAEGYKQREIAEVYGCTGSHVGRIIRRSIDKLKGAYYQSIQEG